MRRLKLYIVIYFLVLFSIPVSAYIFKVEAAKNNQNRIQTAKAPLPVLQATITPTPIPTPVPALIPTIEPSQAPVATSKPTAKKTTSTTPKTAPRPTVAGIPVRVQIPRIGMNAAVEQVGLEADGTMSVPKSWWTVGWYKLGYKIGEAGSAVLSGHYDTNTGAPAVFFRVGSLSPGDTITVTTSNGSVFKYRVIRKESYPWNQMPLQTIFNSSGKAWLNLITCSGTWDRATQNYSHRTVVYAEITN